MKLKYFKNFFLIIVVLYAIIAAYYFLNLQAYGGDENNFRKELSLVLNEGWIEAIKQQISIPYMLLVYPFALVFKDYIALRIVSVLLTLFLLFYLYKRGSKQIQFLGMILFYISTVYFFYIGTNDTLFNVGMIIFLVETYRRLNNQNWNGTLAITALIVSVFTRSLFLIYLPVIVLAIYLLRKEKAFSTINYKLPLLVIALFLVLNIPSITANKIISYDNKVPPKHIKASWSQRQYLAQLLVNEGKLPNGKHPSWEQTDGYLSEHGENSLPNGILQGVFFDLKLTCKEFFKDFFNASLYTFRQIGPILLYMFYLIFTFIKNRGRNGKHYFVPISFFTTLAILSFIIISNVEIRWMAPLYVVAIVLYWKKEESGDVNTKWIIFNYLILTALSLFGILRIVNKI